VKNRIGSAIVERVLRAHESGEPFRVIVCIPAVPAFAGDLHADDSLGTRAIMKYQWASICRGEHSIIGAIKKAGVPDPSVYIRFYNLRNYDRLNVNATMSNVEEASNVNYEDARKDHDDIVGAGYDGSGEGTAASAGQQIKNTTTTSKRDPKSKIARLIPSAVATWIKGLLSWISLGR